MSLSEFGLIQQYFSQPIKNDSVNRLGIGDDCALLSVPKGYELAITTDTMVEGIHFFAGTKPGCVGHKLLAVNLSDLAAMGAEPVAVTLALTMPKVDEDWLTGFSQGFLGLAKKFSVDLVGGDTSTGALTLTIQAMGLIPEGLSMKRSAAKAGDLIFVTGLLGEAGLGLKIKTGYSCDCPEAALKQFHRPEPRVMEALSLRNYANACIDLSDGLASDLKHILKKSNLGATLDWDKIPLSRQVEEYISSTGDWGMPLSAGDDYELCFTVSPENIDSIKIDCTQIGIIEAEAGLRIQRCGETKGLEAKGFEHFS